MLLLSSGCANPINAKTATDYAQAANNAAQLGDWAKARMCLCRAIVNAQLGGSSPAQLAVLYYEHGRASGIVCEFSDAEKPLIRAYDLDKQAGGPTYMSCSNSLGLCWIKRNSLKRRYTMSERFLSLNLYELRLKLQLVSPTFSMNMRLPYGAPIGRPKRRLLLSAGQKYDQRILGRFR